MLIAVAITLYIFAAAAPLSAPRRAFAEETAYARANVSDAYFFLEKDLTTSVFIVPYTYCVQVLREDGDWYYAAYASNNGFYKELKGYCRRADFTPLASKPDVTYLYKTVTVTYKSGEGTSTLPVLNEINVEAAFYGNFYSGATAYSYVYASGSFGYIKGAIDDYPLNITEEKPTDEPPDEVKGSNLNVGLIIALAICGLAALALVMLYYTSRKRGRMD